MATKHQTVSDIVFQVKNLLEGEFRQVSVVGEITNLSSSTSGHYYFTLSDEQSTLSSALFRVDALRNPFIRNCRDGDKVFCQGSLGVYAKRGTFQLIVKNMAPAGKGDLKAQYEALKLKLAGLGLFDPEHKQPIPERPKRVAVITAPGAAALQDFLNIYRRRSMWMDVVLIPSLVQGDGAPASLVHALHQAIRYSQNHPEKAFDVIVMTRGGGSLEDLWAFNDEGLAFEIYHCPIPVISAVGHQVDTTICDYVSDWRSETPSAAAEYLTQGQLELKKRLDYLYKNLGQYIRLSGQELRQKREMLSPRALLSLMKTRLLQDRHKLAQLDFIHRANKGLALSDHWLKLDDLVEGGLRQMNETWQKKSHQLEILGEKLQLLDPHNILERGYVYVTLTDGKLVKTKAQWDALPKNSSLNLHFHDGKVATKN